MPADQNNDRRITLKAMYTFIYTNVYNGTYSLSGGYQGPQSVQYCGPENEVLFTRK